MNARQGQTGHNEPCRELRHVAQNQAVMLRRLDDGENWMRKQNGTLQRLAEQHDRDHESTEARHTQNTMALADLRWQMRLGFIGLGLLLLSEHPMLAAVLKALGI